MGDVSAGKVLAIAWGPVSRFPEPCKIGYGNAHLQAQCSLVVTGCEDKKFQKVKDELAWGAQQ